MHRIWDFIMHCILLHPIEKLKANSVKNSSTFKLIHSCRSNVYIESKAFFNELSAFVTWRKPRSANDANGTQNPPMTFLKKDGMLSQEIHFFELAYIYNQTQLQRTDRD